jgi:hypothetical protein
MTLEGGRVDALSCTRQNRAMGDDVMTFRPGVLGAHDSVMGFRVVGCDGRAGRISWASYAPGESYLVVTMGVRRKHHVVPASAVTSVGDGEVHVALSRGQIGQLHDVPHPHVSMEGLTREQAMNAFWAAADVPQSGGI